MKKEASMLINELFLDCKKLIMSRQTAMEVRTNLFETIKTKSPLLYEYMEKGFYLWECACVPEYIKVYTEYELLLLLRQSLTEEEVQVVVLFKNLLPEAIMTENEQYFQSIYTCETATRDLSAVHLPIQKLLNGFWEWEQIFFPRFVPKGYSAIETIQKRQLRYENDTKDILYFEQFLPKPFFAFPIGIESKKGEIKINNTTGIFVPNKQQKIIYWFEQYKNDTYPFSLSSTNLSLSELIKIAESIAPVDFTKREKGK